MHRKNDIDTHNFFINQTAKDGCVKVTVFITSTKFSYMLVTMNIIKQAQSPNTLYWH